MHKVGPSHILSRVERKINTENVNNVKNSLSIYQIPFAEVDQVLLVGMDQVPFADVDQVSLAEVDQVP